MMLLVSVIALAFLFFIWAWMDEMKMREPDQLRWLPIVLLGVAVLGAVQLWITECGHGLVQ
jgi:hypothetical protein